MLICRWAVSDIWCVLLHEENKQEGWLAFTSREPLNLFTVRNGTVSEQGGTLP